jgi:glycosyltransferase involved in cell wall biosynthesis
VRVCEFLASSGEGGLENHFVDLVDGLSKLHEVHVIGDESFRPKLPESVTFHSFNISRSRFNFFSLVRFVFLIRSISPSILHVHANKATKIASRVKVFLSCPVIATLHGLKKNTSMYDKVDGVIGVSSEVLDNVKNKNKFVVYNGRNLRDSGGFDSEMPSISNKRYIFLAARLADVKRVDLAIQAVANLNDVNLVIAGDGKERQNLEELAKREGVFDRVFFLGYRHDIRKLMELSSIVLISSDREGFPLVMVEALLMRKIVVSTKVPGVKEFVPDKYLSKVGDAEELARKLKFVLDDLAKAEQDFSSVWVRADSELTLDAQIKRTINVLEMFSNEKNKGSLSE